MRSVAQAAEVSPGCGWLLSKESTMQKRTPLFTAVALTVAAMGFTAVAQDAGDKAREAGSAVKDAARDTKDTAKDAVGNIDVRTEGRTGAAAGLPAGIQQASKDDSE